MANIEKITDTMRYEEIKSLLADREDIVEFCDRKIGQIVAKAEKAKEKNAQKKAEGDELREAVAAVLTNEPQLAEDILGQLEGEDLTVAKVRSRLTQLVNLRLASKAEVKVGDKKRMAYTLPIAE
jgi:hypothetical protein